MTQQVELGRSRIPTLEGLRGLAVLAVVADQVGAASGRTGYDDVFAALLRRLDVGIAILFVVSGFLLYQPFADYAASNGARPSVVRFWVRRLLRLLPPLWLTIAITFIVTQRTESTGDWMRHMALVQPLSFFYIHGSLAHLWPVSVLVAFVVVIPVVGRLAGASTRRHVVVVAAMIASASAFNVIQNEMVVHRPVLQWLPAYLDWFAAGMLIAVIRAAQSAGTTSRVARMIKGWADAPGTCWSTAALLWLLSATELGVSREFIGLSFWQWTLQHWLGGLTAFFVVLPLALGRRSAKRPQLGRQVPRFLGAISYGVFLWQLPVLLVVQDRFGFHPFGGHFAIQLLLTTTGAMLCASASWYLFERWLLHSMSRTGVLND